MGLLKKIVKKAGSVIHDVAKTVVDGTLTIPNAIAGKNVVDTGSYKTGAIGSTIGAATNLGTDVAKVATYNVVAPINSITGHQYNPDYETKVGTVTGELGEMGVDSVHVLGKTIGDTFTGGYASKLVNTIRKDENKESFLNYHEANNVASIKQIESIRKPLMKTTKTLGVIIGSKGSQTSTKVPVNTLAAANTIGASGDNFMYQPPAEEKPVNVGLVVGVVSLVAAIIIFVIKILR